METKTRTRTRTENETGARAQAAPKVYIKTEAPGAAPPEKDSYLSAGYDLTVPEDTHIPARARTAVSLGFAMSLPAGVAAIVGPLAENSAEGMPGMGVGQRVKRLLGIPLVSCTALRRRFDADVIAERIDPGAARSVTVTVCNRDIAFTVPQGTRIAQITFVRPAFPQVRLAKELTGYASPDAGQTEK